MFLWIAVGVAAIIAIYLIANSSKRTKGRTTPSASQGSKSRSLGLPAVDHHGGRKVSVSEGFGTAGTREGSKQPGRKAPEKSPKKYGASDDVEMKRLKQAKPFTPGAKSIIPPPSGKG